MNNKKIILSSLALDLRRVALGYHRGSMKMADRFLEEAMKRTEEAKTLSMQNYLVRLLSAVDQIKEEKNISKKAEDALMFSTLFQNASLQ